MVNTPGRSINEKNRRAPGGLFFLPIFLGYIYRLWIKPPWPQFISARLAALKLISEHSWCWWNILLFPQTKNPRWPGLIIRDTF